VIAGPDPVGAIDAQHRRMRAHQLLPVLVAIGCGDGSTTSDAGTDAPPPGVDAPLDPFAGMYDELSDFPRDDCTPGSLTGFSYAGIYRDIGLWTTFDGELRTYLAPSRVDVLVPHLLTPDDLLVRISSNGSLIAIHACGADSDGTLHGSFFSCHESIIEYCTLRPMVASPLHRIAGEVEGLGLTRVGEWNGGGTWPTSLTTNVRVAGNVAYLSRAEDGIRIVSIANPAAPTDLGHFVAPGDYVNDLKLVVGDDSRRYVVTASFPCRTIDVTSPGAPELAAEIPVNAHSLFIEGQTAYFASGGFGPVEVYSLANPRAPVKLGEWEAPEGAAYHDLYVSGGIAYLSESSGGGLEIVDLRDPANPSRIGFEALDGTRYWHSPWLTTVGGSPLVVHGDELSGADGGFSVIDADPASSTFMATVGTWTSPRAAVSIHNVMAFGSRVYLAHYYDGVRVIDLSDPTAPAQVGYYNTWIDGTGPAWIGGAFGIDLDLAAQRIYVADSIRGLMILAGDATVFP
jgi:hypothetical protein